MTMTRISSPDLTSCLDPHRRTSLDPHRRTSCLDPHRRTSCWETSTPSREAADQPHCFISHQLILLLAQPPESHWLNHLRFGDLNAGTSEADQPQLRGCEGVRGLLWDVQPARISCTPQVFLPGWLELPSAHLHLTRERCLLLLLQPWYVEN